MSSVRTSATVQAPLYHGDRRGNTRRGGGIGPIIRRRRERREEYRPRPKPVDKMSRVDMGPGGWAREAFPALLKNRGGANLGQPPKLKTAGDNLKSMDECTAAVRNWLSGMLNAANGLMRDRYSEGAVAFVHLLRSARDAGLFDEVLALVTQRLRDRLEDDDGDESD